MSSKSAFKELADKARLKNCDPKFIEIIESEPLYPIEFTDHDVPEFGKKVIFNGDKNVTGMKHGEIGFVLGIARNNPSVGRPEGWMEIVFPNGANTYVYGMKFDDVEFLKQSA